MEALRWFVATEEELKAASDASRKLSSANEQVLSLSVPTPTHPPPMRDSEVRIWLHLFLISPSEES
jgi:hypothetical protein